MTRRPTGAEDLCILSLNYGQFKNEVQIVIQKQKGLRIADSSHEHVLKTLGKALKRLLTDRAMNETLNKQNIHTYITQYYELLGPQYNHLINDQNIRQHIELVQLEDGIPQIALRIRYSPTIEMNVYL